MDELVQDPTEVDPRILVGGEKVLVGLTGDDLTRIMERMQADSGTPLFHKLVTALNLINYAEVRKRFVGG